MASFAVEISVVETGRKKPQYSIGGDLDGEMTLVDLLEWTKAALIITADEILKEEQAKGFDPTPVIAVDGRIGKPVQAVHPLGQIEFASRQSAVDIITDTYNGILYRSKVRSGDYKAHNYVFHRGRQVAVDLASLEAWIKSEPKINDGDRIRFVNIQPYARKLENRGITAQRNQARNQESRHRKKHGTGATHILVPNGTYALTARSIRAKYKRNSSIKFTYISGGTLGIAGTFKSGGRKGKNSAGRPYLYPSIEITIQAGGVT